MITFRQKAAAPQPANGDPHEGGKNRFEQIRRQAADARKKSDADATRRRARQTAEDNRLL
jgi:hypothetical protein